MQLTGTLRGVVRGTDPRCFAMVMATGIVSDAVRLAGHAGLSVALLWVAAAAFAVLIVASAWRIARFGSMLRGELRRADRLFSYFAFPAAASVLAGGLAAAPGPAGLVATLAAVTALAWIVLSGTVVAFLATWAGPRRAITAVNGSWQLWVVGTQSTAIAATSAAEAGVLPDRPAAWVAVVAWSAGAVLYVAITALVIIRLRTSGLASGETIAPYWVTMGAASITVLAAAQTVQATEAAGLPAVRSALTGAGLGFWSVATLLIPALALISVARWWLGQAPRGFRREFWMTVFPLGMYATASMRIAVTAGVTPIHTAGTGAAWVAAVVWAVVFIWMAGSAAIYLRYSEQRGSASGHDRDHHGAGRGDDHNRLGEH